MTEPAAAPRPPSRRRQIAGALVTVAVVAAVFAGALPRIADYRGVASALAGLSLPEVGALAAVTGWCLVAYALAQAVAVPGLRVIQAVTVHQAATALSHTVPSGGALALGLTFAAYRSFGIELRATTAGLGAVGAWEVAARLVLPTAAVTALAVSGRGGVGLTAAAAAGLAVLAGLVAVLGAALRSERAAHRAGAVLGTAASRVRARVGRDPVDLAAPAVRLRAELLAVVRERGWRLTAITAGNHLGQVVLLLLALRVVGVGSAQVPAALGLAGYAVARTATAIPVTPGGVGVVELGTVALLAWQAEPAARDAIAAGVLLFRALTYLAPIPLGLAAWLFLRLQSGWRAGS